MDPSVIRGPRARRPHRTPAASSTPKDTAQGAEPDLEHATGYEVREDGQVLISGDGSYWSHLCGWDLPEAEQVARSKALVEANEARLARERA